MAPTAIAWVPSTFSPARRAPPAGQRRKFREPEHRGGGGGEGETANPLSPFFKLTASGPMGQVKYPERPREIQANVSIAGNVFSS